MKKKDVTIGTVYLVRLNGGFCPVRLTGKGLHNGWNGINENTGRQVHIKSAAKLRYPLSPEQVAKLK